MCPIGQRFSAKQGAPSARLSMRRRKPLERADVCFEDDSQRLRGGARRAFPAPPPAMTHGRMGAPDARRFAVSSQRNVTVGLIGALEARYPVSRRIVGDDFFRAIARIYVSAHTGHARR